MSRTTIDLDAAVLRELKRRKRSTGQSLGQLASELLAAALRGPAPARPALRWRSARMGARIDLEDPEAVRRATESA